MHRKLTTDMGGTFKKQLAKGSPVHDSMAAFEPSIPQIDCDVSLVMSGQENYKSMMEDIIEANINLDQFTRLEIWGCTLELAGYQVPIAAAIRRMKNLTSLQLRRVELHSSTFVEIESKELERLKIQSKELEPLQLYHGVTRLPCASLFKSDLCYKDSLVELRLETNLWSEIPNGIFQFPNLLVLSLTGNYVTELPDKFTNLPKLQKLKLSHNDLKHVPPSIFSLQNLSKLCLRCNLISELPDMFTNLPKLESLLLDINQLGCVPPSIFALQNLYELLLNDNGITELPDMFTKLSKLKCLSLDSNQLTYLPPSIFTLQNLSISWHCVTELCDKFTNVPKLMQLSLTNNQFPHLPRSIFKLHLSQLQIEDNEFYFQIPPSVDSELTVHSLKELSYRSILNHKLKVKEGMLPEKFLKDLDNYHQCVCGCKFVDEGQDLLFFCNLKDIYSYSNKRHFSIPVRGKMCTSLKSCFLDRFPRYKYIH